MTTGQQGRVAAPSDGVMHRHFEAIADDYSRVRTLDAEPVRRIARLLPRRPGLVVADVGCGDGRYTELLLEELNAPRLICVDSVPEMLAQAEARLALAGAPEVVAVRARAEDFAPAAGSLDAILSFNAVHHFALGPFLECSEAALRPGGRLFIYTRLQSQNARTIWGRYFPRFAERETRLRTLPELRGAVAERAGLSLEGATHFRFPRTASLRRLCDQARSRHYSTFALYEPDEFEAALRAFADSIRSQFPDPDRVSWVDENLLLEVGRR